MSRPHEDLERHTLVDHRHGGEPIFFEVGAWFAVEIAHVKRSRIDAALAAYETMIERSRVSVPEQRAAGLFSAATDREVVALCGVAGHEEFRHLQTAWDDHHRYADRHAVTESRTLRLYRVTETSGDMAIDPGSSDAYVFERIARDRASEPPSTSDAVAAAGFLGVTVFRSDDGNRSIVIYRFERLDQFESLRVRSLPRTEHMYPIKTFAASPDVRTSR